MKASKKAKQVKSARVVLVSTGTYSPSLVEALTDDQVMIEAKKLQKATGRVVSAALSTSRREAITIKEQETGKVSRVRKAINLVTKAWHKAGTEFDAEQTSKRVNYIMEANA